MNKHLKKIKAIKIGWDKVPVGEAAFESDGLVYVSAEHAHTAGWIDYYGEFRGGYPVIPEELEAYAEKIGGYWEWQNPGCIVLAE